MGVGTLQPIKATYDSEVQDTVTLEVDYQHGSVITDPTEIITVINEASNPALTTGFVIPKRRARFGSTSLFARRFTVEQNDVVRSRFKFSIEYMKPEQRSAAAFAVADMHPIFMPPQIFIERIDKEVAIDKAYNVQALVGRPANTFGPVTNSVGVETEFPLMETTSKGVIVIRRNVNTAVTGLNLNAAFDLTTNSDSVVVLGKTYSPRQLGYLCSEMSDELEFDDMPYWQMETRINIEKTTDRKVHSTGYRAYNSGGKLVDITGDKDHLPNTDGQGEPVSEPVPILLSGAVGNPSAPVEITYYYREPVAYASFFV